MGVKGKKHLVGREESDPRTLSMDEQEEAVIEAGGELEEDDPTFQEAVVEEAEKQGVALEDVKSELDEVEQKSLPGMPPGTVKTTVDGTKMLAEFVKPHFYMDEDTRFCALEFSFPLGKDHKGMLPKSVEDAWKFIEKGGRKGVVGIEMPDQDVNIFLANDMDDVELNMGTVEIKKANISLIKEIGKGASSRVVRFSFRVIAEADKDVYTFAATNFGNAVWIQMLQKQGELAL
jgi:hypothetical protein